jgi:hypothetical protein
LAEPPEELEEPQALKPIAAAQTETSTARVFLVIATFFIGVIERISVVMLIEAHTINKIGIRPFRCG